VNGSNFQIEQQCPQCGAPIILDEADRILSCKFCRTRVYLATEDIFHFYIPPAEGISGTIYFIPYWRTKGLSYTIKGMEMNMEYQGQSFSSSISSTINGIDISYTYLDANFLSFDSKLFPFSLGLRPQAMKLKFMGSNENEGIFLTSSGKTRETLIKNHQKNIDSGHREVLIGEIDSVIYTPVYFANGRIFDAVLKKPLDLLQKEDGESEQTLASAPAEKWHVEFIPMLCPECGADLPGEKDALVIFCDNCHCAWNQSDKNFTKVKFSTWQEKGEDITYLPFWQMKVKVNGFQLETYADLIKVANIPKVPSEEWTKTPFYFCAPAFKINPALFLRWCRQLTATPAPIDLTEDFPAKKIYPATLPVNDALKSCLLTLVNLISNKRSLVEILPSLNFTLEDNSLVLHPFKTNARELVHTKIGFGMELSALNMGAYL
jgi:hypothetical protein